MKVIEGLRVDGPHTVFLAAPPWVRAELAQRLSRRGDHVLELVDGSADEARRDAAAGLGGTEAPGDAAVLVDPLLTCGDEDVSVTPQASAAIRTVLQLVDSAVPHLYHRGGLLVLVLKAATVDTAEGRSALALHADSIEHLRRELAPKGVRLSQVRVHLRRGAAAVSVELQVRALADIVEWVIHGRSVVDVDEMRVTV